jgi:hypothetical protein
MVDGKKDLPELTEDTWDEWSPMAEAFLVVKGLDDTLDPDFIKNKGDPADDRKARAHLTLQIGPEFRSVVVSSKTAAEAWSELEKIFAAKSQAKKVQLKQEMSNLKMTNETATQYVQRARVIREKMKTVGMTSVDDVELVLQLVAGLPKPRFIPFIPTYIQCHPWRHSVSVLYHLSI